MIFLQLFLTYCKIGIFNFGGGYAVIALIQHEIVEKHGWMTIPEFTDIVAASQMTPGPIGINVATYTGYTAVVNAGYAEWTGVLGALLASFAVILLPFLLLLLISGFILKHKDNPDLRHVFGALRPAVIGLVAAAALLLATPENFGSPHESKFQFMTSIALFAGVFTASAKFKASPILLIVMSGLAGFLLYG